MNRITVSASSSYNVLIGTDLLPQIGTLLPKTDVCTQAIIISDSNVWPLYGTSLESALIYNGFHTVHYVLLAGENSKSPENYLEILNFLADHQFTRTDYLIALGGGVVGDITGFVASTFMRGVPYIQIPTSLLAMVDSSVGGKTAINLPKGKNLVGAFYQPKMVICDISTLLSLPYYFYLDGCAEIIKYAILYDPELFLYLEEKGLQFDPQFVISRCIEHKRDVVLKDEFDSSVRQMLNLGHTIGHSIEVCSNFTISHGRAVSIGIATITRSALSNGICSKATAERILNLLTIFSLPTKTEIPIQNLVQTALSDKKRSSNSINIIIPIDIGNCAIHSIPISSFQATIEAGL